MTHDRDPIGLGGSITSPAEINRKNRAYRRCDAREERAEVAPSVAKSLANRWAAMSEATREMEIDNALAVREYSARLAERQAIQAPPLLDEDAVIIAAAHGDPRDGLRKALAELAVATEARGAAAETAERIVRAAVAARPYSAPCRHGCTPERPSPSPRGR